VRVGTAIFSSMATSDPTALVPYEYPAGASDILNLSTGELALDKDFKIAYVSPTFLDTVGYDEKDLLGRDLSILLPADMPESIHTQNLRRKFPEGLDYHVILISANRLPVPDPQPDPNKLHSVFVSYKRKTSKKLATRVTSFLIEAGYNVWLDTQAIPDGSDFTQYIKQGILSSQKFMPFITLEYLKEESIHCDKEMQLAIEMHKPILPIVQEEEAIGEFNRRYPQIENLSWFFFRPGIDDPGASFKRIVSFLEEDVDFYRESTIYLQHATEWKEGQRDLMLGPEARLASTWLELNRKKHKYLSPFTTSYIQKSNDAYRRSQQLPMLAAVALLAVLGGASIILLLLVSQRNQLLARSERDGYKLQIEAARSSSLVALYLSDSQPCQSLDKAIQALKEADGAFQSYEAKFPPQTAEDDTELFELRKKLNYTRINLSEVMNRQMASGSTEALIQEAEAQLGLKEQRGNCEVQ